MKKLMTSIALVSTGLLTSVVGYANENTWRGVLSVGSGIVMASDLGESKDFPIINPVTDSFYSYTADNNTQTVSALDLFAGTELALDLEWAIQFGLGYTTSADLETKGTVLQGADLGSSDLYTYHYDNVGRQLMVEGKFLYTFGKIYHPYLFGGLGVAINSAIDYGTDVPETLTFTREYKDNTETSFTYSVGLGIDINVLDSLRLGVGYRFADLGNFSLGDAHIDNVPVNGTLSKNHIYASEIIAQFIVMI